jgi:cytochrome c553
MRARSILLSLAGLTLQALLATSAPAISQTGANKALGRYLSSECVTCHQITGQYEGIPPIVGWPVESFAEIMDEYRSKKRENPIMQTIAGRLSSEEIAALAAYFGSLSTEPTSRPTTKEGKKGRIRQ